MRSQPRIAFFLIKSFFQREVSDTCPCQKLRKASDTLRVIYSRRPSRSSRFGSGAGFGCFCTVAITPAGVAEKLYDTLPRLNDDRCGAGVGNCLYAFNMLYIDRNISVAAFNIDAFIIALNPERFGRIFQSVVAADVFCLVARTSLHRNGCRMPAALFDDPRSSRD